jgi:hypothetical protein
VGREGLSTPSVGQPWVPIEAVRPPLPPPQPGWRPGGLVVTLIVAIAVLLVADAVAVFIMVMPDGSATSSVATGGRGRTVLVTPDQVPPPTAKPLERELPGLMRFVQEQRGLPFVRPVKVALLGDKAFVARLRGRPSTAAESTERATKIKTQERVLKAYGLIGSDVDLGAIYDAFYTEAIAGFYDPKADDLVVRGDQLTPYVRVVMVHELTHALQDQHFNVDRTELNKKDDESATALTALVEGDAVRIETLYFESRPQEEQKEIEKEEMVAASRPDPTIPQSVLQLLYFPYLAGPPFTRDVVTKGGQPALDAAYVTPPTTSEQIIHADVFLQHQGPAVVEAPKPAGKRIDQGVLGEFGLRLVLEVVAGKARADAAQGWGGDRYVAWAKGDRACVRTAIAMDTRHDTDELRLALGAYATERKGTTVTGPPEGPLTFTTCG